MDQPPFIKLSFICSPKLEQSLPLSSIAFLCLVLSFSSSLYVHHIAVVSACASTSGHSFASMPTSPLCSPVPCSLATCRCSTNTYWVLLICQVLQMVNVKLRLEPRLFTAAQFILHHTHGLTHYTTHFKELIWAFWTMTGVKWTLVACPRQVSVQADKGEA